VEGEAVKLNENKPASISSLNNTFGACKWQNYPHSRQHQIHKFQRSIHVVIEFYDLFPHDFSSSPTTETSKRENISTRAAVFGGQAGRGVVMGILYRLQCEILELVFVWSN
jgi:hypothetical protein